MPKRKREDDGDDADFKLLSAKQQRIQHKLAQGTRKVAQAVKLAKSFERQKLGRREKTARDEKIDKDVVRVESEIAALKTLDHAASAQMVLYKTLNKIKAVTSSDLFTDLLVLPGTVQHDIAAQNIHARLCNSKTVREALNSAIDEILQAAHIQLKGPQKGQKQRPKGGGSANAEDKAATKQNEDQELSVVESDVSSEAAFSKFDSRLASSDDESEQEISDMDVSRLEQQLHSEGIRGKSDYFSGSEDEYGEEGKAEEDGKGEEDDDFEGFEDTNEFMTSKPRSAIARKDVVKTSTILPSLTLGGYISGSDGSDIEEVDVAPRKNRRGQRARQAIAEKKFGQQAKHLQKAANSRDQGWDMKRGATGGRDGRAYGQGGKSGAQHKQDATTAKPKKDDAGPLHPSWEAAKRAKEKSIAIPAFAGKKISFG